MACLRSAQHEGKWWYPPPTQDFRHFTVHHCKAVSLCWFVLEKKKNNQNIAQEVHSIRDIRGFFFVAVFTIKTETFWPVSVSEKVSKVHQ